MKNLKDDIEKVLFTEVEIKEKIKEIGKKVSIDYEDKEIILVGVLKGSVPFMADLLREITIPCSMDFMAVSSYGNSTKTSGIVRILKDLDSHIENKNILIVEDIIDTGITLRYLVDYLKVRKPASIKIACLLDKPDRRKADIKIDYFAFKVPDFFLVGYGLDYAQLYRNLPYVGILKKEIYE